MSHQRAWMLLAFGDKRQYRGNTGYDDELTSRYQYDSLVGNSKNLTPGDIVLPCNADGLLGVARVESVASVPGTKPHHRCPATGCGTTNIKARATKRPRYRCKHGHEFDTPVVSENAVQLKTAHFGNTFVAAVQAIPVGVLRDARLRPNDQLSIQEVSLDAIGRRLRAAAPASVGILAAWSPTEELAPDDAEEDGATKPVKETEGVDDFVIPCGQRRDDAVAQVRRRRGQKSFRTAIRRRYGDQCLITGCTVLDLLDAAHVVPYTGRGSNHHLNGLLLRTDLHTLWDTWLIAIHPESLAVRLHPSLRDSEYGYLDGVVLRCAGGGFVRVCARSAFDGSFTSTRTRAATYKHPNQRRCAPSLTHVHLQDDCSVARLSYLSIGYTTWLALSAPCTKRRWISS